VPELGRCVSNPGHGGFKGTRASCIRVSKTHTGNFDWHPGPSETGATVKIKLSNPVFETTGGERIGCSFLFANGGIQDGKTAKITEVVLQGCQLVGPKYACFSNPVAPGTIESTKALKMELGFITNPKNAANPYVGWDLKAESEVSKAILEFSCAEAKIPSFEITIEGSVIAQVKKVNKMLTVFQLYYKQAAGIQNPTTFKGGVEDVLTQITTPVLNPTGAKTEQVGLQAAGGEMEISEPVEIKQRQVEP
jgi:hypothetical protein